LERPRQPSNRRLQPPHTAVTPLACATGAPAGGRLNRSVRRTRVWATGAAVGIPFFCLFVTGCATARSSAPSNQEREKPARTFLRELNEASPGDPVFDDEAPENRGRITPPALIEKRKPFYPEGLRLQRKEGRVLVGGVIERDGSVSHVRTLSSSGEADFDVAALQAVSACRYRAAAISGKPVRVVLTVTVSFGLQ